MPKKNGTGPRGQGTKIAKRLGRRNSDNIHSWPPGQHRNASESDTARQREQASCRQKGRGDGSGRGAGNGRRRHNQT